MFFIYNNVVVFIASFQADYALSGIFLIIMEAFEMLLVIDVFQAYC